jgi:hypothetical protein
MGSGCDIPSFLKENPLKFTAALHRHDAISALGYRQREEHDICIMAASEAPDASYTVFIRLPFPRGDFVDPPAVGRSSIA